MTGGEGKPIGRQNFGPAVRFDLTGARTLAEALERFEYEYADDGGECSGGNGGKPLRSTENKKKDCGRVPDPTIAEARGGQHPITNPARRAPAIQAPHQAMIAAFNESPDVAGDGHFVTSPQKSSEQNQASRRVGSRSHSKRGADSPAFTFLAHVLQKRISLNQ